MLKKHRTHELWFHVKDEESIGLIGRVPELLRLDLISIGPAFVVEDLNDWLYITRSGEFRAYRTFEDAKADLA